jgi:hypothetical protein
MILVLHYYKSIIDGVMTSLIDTFFNIRRSLGSLVGARPVYMKIVCPELYLLNQKDYYNFDLDNTQWYEYVNDTGVDVKKYEKVEDSLIYNMKLYHNKLTTAIPFMRFNRNFGDFNLFRGITQTEHKFKANTIICSGRLIYEILMGADIELECERLFVLDSLDTYKSKIGEFPDFDDYFDILETDVTQLSNPATMRDTKYRQELYFHKFSFRRLNSLKQLGILEDEYNYNRTSKEKGKLEGGYYENQGKGIFEHLYWNKKVNYCAEGIYTADGLTHYLDLFGIDPYVDHFPLHLSKNQIKDKLFMKNVDYLYKELRH